MIFLKELHNKNIIITGASSGIGEKIATRVAARGANPILVARSETKLEQLQTELTRKFAVECRYYVADLVDVESWKTTLQQIIADAGKVDALINNAGVGIFEYVNEASWESTDRMFQLNVMALIQAVYQVLPHFIEQGHGHIVNIASMAGKIATPKAAVYSSTKHAVLGFSNALRLETAATGVYVTTVNLGPVKTNFFTTADPEGTYQQSVQRYMLDPDQVAKKVVNSLFTKKREINMPGWMDAGSKVYSLFPHLFERLLKNQFNKKG
ncbi:SDR family NAD(P)-dependent oxidoreductase [Radiobacillus sp. PE A8.2]|uniref:SDR family NAD(P)-dependent oxidoreductase n=1 Tax=Radiobacillus sp. PE A8.2 TaxID=3380349 RepID=UPI00388D3204